MRSDVAAILTAWLAEQPGEPTAVVFASSRGGGRLSADAVQRLVARHLATARLVGPSLQTKAVTPHTLRHAAAMALLQCGVDLSVIALWLGHESTETTEVYLHADMALKERALAHASPSGLVPSRFRPPDPLLAFLEAVPGLRPSCRDRNSGPSMLRGSRGERPSEHWWHDPVRKPGPGTLADLQMVTCLRDPV